MSEIVSSFKDKFSIGCLYCNIILILLYLCNKLSQSESKFKQINLNIS